MILADVQKRYKELWGKEAVLATGTDEHGMKVHKSFDKVDFRYKKRHLHPVKMRTSIVQTQLRSSRYP
jgi:methionyl-tRNA synthetase